MSDKSTVVGQDTVRATGPASTARLIVTGETAAGKSVVVSDRHVDPVRVAAAPGVEFYRLWGSDETIRLPTSSQPPSMANYFPPVNGFRFVIVEMGPDRDAHPAEGDMQAAIEEMREKLPGLVDVMEPKSPGMHRSDTVDFGVVLSGQAWLELDDGMEVRLETGDSVILNGIRHAWHNRSARSCALVLAAVGAQRT